MQNLQVCCLLSMIREQREDNESRANQKKEPPGSLFQRVGETLCRALGARAGSLPKHMPFALQNKHQARDFGAQE